MYILYTDKNLRAPRFKNSNAFLKWSSTLQSYMQYVLSSSTSLLLELDG